MAIENYSEALKEAMASAPADEVMLHTLEIQHDAFVDDAGNPAAIRVVRDNQDLEARLEASASMNPGEIVNFVAMAFKVKLPGFESGQLPQLEITLDNASREVTKHLEQAISSSSPIKIIWRMYLASDPLSGPDNDPPYVMILTSAKVTLLQVTGTATLDDLQNLSFPNRLYTTTDFPGLLR
jgi:hypothetical protein